MLKEGDHLNRVFAALSDPTRRAMLHRLSLGEVTVSELAEPFQMSLPAISKHLKVLERAGLLQRRVEGRKHYCSLLPLPLREASGWFTRYHDFWDTQMDRLQQYLETSSDDEGNV